MKVKQIFSRGSLFDYVDHILSVIDLPLVVNGADLIPLLVDIFSTNYLPTSSCQRS